MAKLRHQTFFSLAELNHCIRALLTELNQKPFKQMPGNRQQWFETLDQPALSPLPEYAYQYTDIKTARVNIDYHLIYDQHLYSVPHHFVGEQVELHAGDKLMEVYFHNRRIATPVTFDRNSRSRSPKSTKKLSALMTFIPRGLFSW